jgi:hypothetical protein
MTDTITPTPPRTARPDATDARVDAHRRAPAEVARPLDVFDGREHGRARRALRAFAGGND